MWLLWHRPNTWGALKTRRWFLKVEVRSGSRLEQSTSWPFQFILTTNTVDVILGWRYRTDSVTLDSLSLLRRRPHCCGYWFIVVHLLRTDRTTCLGTLETGRCKSRWWWRVCGWRTVIKMRWLWLHLVQRQLKVRQAFLGWSFVCNAAC